MVPETDCIDKHFLHKAPPLRRQIQKTSSSFTHVIENTQDSGDHGILMFSLASWMTKMVLLHTWIALFAFGVDIARAKSFEWHWMITIYKSLFCVDQST